MDFSKMNDNQIQAVKHVKGPCRVIAGAGSGKTTVLTHRIQYLIEEAGVKPDTIVGITFTKKAASEMETRLKALLGDEAGGKVTLRTFHSFCLGKIIYSYCYWLEKKGRPFKIINPQYKEKSAILNEDSQMRLVANAIASEHAVDLDLASTIDFITWQKNYAIFPDDEPKIGCLADDVADEKVQEYMQVYKAYEKEKKEQGKIDMDDMLTIALEILRKDREFRAFIQNKYKFFLVDEFQDTNVAQYCLIKEIMSGLSKNIFIVGDARQSIYGWRGSRVEYILNFEDDWENATTVELNDNYRSTVEIVDLSTELIRHSPINYPGVCRSGWGTHGLPAQSFSMHDKQEEARAVANLIIDDMEKNPTLDFSKFAVLYRLNSQSTSIIFEFMEKNIPFKIKKSDSFLEKREIKELLGFLSLANKDDDYVSFILVARMLSNTVSKNIVKEIAGKIKGGECGVRQGIKEYDFGADFDAEEFLRRDFIYLLDTIKKYDEDDEHTIKDVFMKILGFFDYPTLLHERYQKKEDAEKYAQSLFEGIANFVNYCERFKTSNELLDYIDKQYEKNKESKDENKVQLLTLHSSKGLEFNTVFLIGTNNGTLPHFKSIKYDEKHNIDMESIEEERRLFYVGITRAQEKLYISKFENDANDKPAAASVFWDEISPMFDNITSVLPEDKIYVDTLEE